MMANQNSGLLDLPGTHPAATRFRGWGTQLFPVSYSPLARIAKTCNSIGFSKLRTLCTLAKTQVSQNQQLTSSFAKTPGVGVSTQIRSVFSAVYRLFIRRLFALAALSFYISLSFPAVLPAQPPTSRSSAPKTVEAKPTEMTPMEAKIDAIFAPLTDAKSPGFAVLVRKDDRTVFERGYGAGDLRSFAKIDPHTNFRLASFTKQFTAMSVMLLVRQGKLRYDSSLKELFPEFPAYGKSITIRHLLTHTAGLPDYE